MAYNTQFMQMLSLSQMLDLLFETPATEEEAEILTSYQIIELLNAHFLEFNQTKGTPNEVGKYFGSHGFACEKRKKGVVYSVKRKQNE